MQLTRALLPQLRAQPAAAVLNVGSVFGSIAYPGFAAYSASKFALRGYTEALRRELADSSVSVHYLAPRATRTGFNASSVERMNAELGVAMDPPETVAAAACEMLERGRPYAVLGWPERLFVRINSLLPRVVDGSLRKQLPVIRRHAAEAAAGAPR
jgi:short-subunit dehydrogenase